MNIDSHILIETSARHIHLEQEHLDILFGKNYKLSIKKDLSQPNQYLCEEKIKIVGPKRELDNISILGPLRNKTQIEISMTDARFLGINAPINESGDFKNSVGCKLVGPKGSLEIDNGVIIAQRHIHLSCDDAKKFCLNDKEIVKTKIMSERTLIFDKVLIRVNKNFKTRMHIDVDEANAAAIKNNITYAIIIKNNS